MKNILVLFMASLFFIPGIAMAENQMITEIDGWGKGDDRSISSVPKLVSIDSDAIYIYSARTIDLDVVIEDLSGNILYSESIIISGRTQYPVPVYNLAEGEYVITVSQGENYVIGHFLIEYD